MLKPIRGLARSLAGLLLLSVLGATRTAAEPVAWWWTPRPATCGSTWAGPAC